MAECPTCGNNYKSEFGVKQHHAKTHGESIVRVDTTCAYCGDDLRVKRKRYERYERLFCDNDCYHKWESDTYSGEGNPNFQGRTVHTDCDWCGEEFSMRADRYEKHDHTFCSTGCCGDWRSKNLVGEDHPKWRGYVDVVCHHCGEDVSVKVSAHEKHERHFCDRRCMGDWYSETYVGEDHPGWKGGYFPYGVGWNKKKREAVRERDSFECQQCGMSQASHIDEYGRKLHVHHIIPAREFDNAEKRNSMENLVTLCQTHHNMYEQIPGLKPDRQKRRIA